MREYKKSLARRDKLYGLMQDISNKYQVGLDVDTSDKKPVLFKNSHTKPASRI